MRNITLTCLKILIDEKCDEIDENFKKEVGKFIKNCIMTGGEQNLSILREMEQQMSAYEKDKLAQYLV